MNCSEVAHLGVCSVLWRVTLARRGGRGLIKAVNSTDETIRTAAAMLLARGSSKARQSGFIKATMNDPRVTTVGKFELNSGHS